MNPTSSTTPAAPPRPELSFVIPVYNGSETVTRVVERIHAEYADLTIEVILVNDGSPDDSEGVCQALQDRYPETLTFVHLARNFGEHNAVMAGLAQATGTYVAILDDDGQNPPEEVRRLYDEIRRGGFDVVYGRYRVKHHSRFRNWGSRFNDRVANVMLGKPPELYLSSFKIMNRFMLEEIVQYRSGFPYIDGHIMRTTSNLGQIEVEHATRDGARSNYTLKRLFFIWLDVFLNFSILPLRISAFVGACTALVSLLLMASVVIDKLYINPGVAVGIPTVLIAIVFFAGVQLLILGTIGEYLGRIFLDLSGNPQYVVRYVRERRDPRS